MIKKSLSLLLIFISWCSISLWSHITNITLIELTDDRQIFVMHDADKGASVNTNLMQAVAILQGVKQTALKNSTNRIELSFMDPAVYDVQDKLIEYLPLLRGPLLNEQFDGYFLSPINKEPGTQLYDVMSFKKHDDITSFVGGDLVKLMALSNQNEWPANLTIRSNDPRHQHYLSLIHQKEYLENNGDILRMSDLLKPSWKFREKEHFFTAADVWTDEFVAKIKNRAKALRQTEESQVLAFSRFVENRNGIFYSPQMLGQPISYFKDKIDLDLVYEFLLEQEYDPYAEAPVLDLLLSLFKKERCDFSFVILRDDYAKKFIEVLDVLGVIREKSMGDVDKNLARLFQGLKSIQ